MNVGILDKSEAIISTIGPGYGFRSVIWISSDKFPQQNNSATNIKKDPKAGCIELI